MICRNSGTIAIADIFVMRRHDFNAGFIKHILYLLVKHGVSNMLLIGDAGIRIDLVTDIKIIQTGLKDKRCRIFFY